MVGNFWKRVNFIQIFSVHLFGYTPHTNLKAAEEQARKDKTTITDEAKLIALINAAQKAHDSDAI